MIKTLEIKNFKSIKHLQLDCKRVNVFIGKPNTGKSNLLESIGVFSLPFVHGNLGELVRFKNMANLFHEQDVSEEIKINTDIMSLGIKFENGKFLIREEDKEKNMGFSFELDSDGKGGDGGYQNSPFKFYRFAVMDRFVGWESDFLVPPIGKNLLQMLLTKKELRKAVAGLFSEYGFKLVLKPQEYEIEIQKAVQKEENIVTYYPYALISDTLQRVVFHHVAIETNKNSIIIFEEPEAHAFPFYTKFLAERMALDESNQYFVSTHNPYFLLSVLEKTSKDDIGIFITYCKEYRTQLRPLSENELPEILDLDASVFFNLDQFLEEA